jgi:predicted NBD/HSP70 family sugar kinase
MYILIDIGGTKTRIGVARNFKGIESFKIYQTPANYREALEKMVEVINGLLGRRKVQAISLGVGTPIDKAKTRVSFHSHKETFKDWVDKPLKKDLRDKFKCKVFLENDAVMGAMGEAIFGAGKDFNLVAFLTISTGVGGAMIIDGQPVKTAWGSEPGWQIIGSDKSGRIITEMDLSGNYIRKRTGKKPSQIDDEKFWRHEAKQLAKGLFDTIVFWSPEIIILGGSLMKKIKLSEVRVALKKIPSPFPQLPIIRKAKLGDQVGLYGALAYLKNNLK